MTTDSKGYYKKFRVIREETGAEITEPTFTLIPSRDPWAKLALLAYAEAAEAENPQLAADVRALVQ